MEISEQQRVIAEVQTELKHEMKKLRGNQESSSHVRPLSFTCRDVHVFAYLPSAAQAIVER